MSQLTIVANLAADPELKFTANGRALLKMRAAVNHDRYDRNTREWVQDGTDWFDVEMWGAKAEAAAETLRKGTRVVVLGRLRIEEYEDRDGVTRRAPKITATEVGVIAKAERSPAPAADPWAADSATPF